MDEAKKPEVPSAPTIDRRPEGRQWPALLILLLLPVLAALGVFGYSTGTARAEEDGLRLEVVYPSRSRFGAPGQLDVKVTNLSPAELDTVMVAIDTTYLSAFRDVSAVPDFDEPYAFRLVDFRPAETRKLRLEVRAAGYGLKRGTIEARHDAESAGLHIQTFIFP